MESISAPFLTSREPVVIVITPPFPSAPSSRLVATPVENSEFSPSKTTVSVALIFTVPAFPLPQLMESISAPFLTAREPVVIVITPPFPSAPFSTTLVTPVKMSKSLTPSKTTASLASIVTLPAVPSPEMVVPIIEALLTESEPVLILTLPLLPTAFSSTSLSIKLLSAKLILPIALISISPP